MSLNGKKISEFQVKAYQNGDFIDVSDKDLIGKWSVLFFYPADFTFVCPTELEDLQNKYDEFKKIGCEIYSVSCDTHFVHKAWHESSERIGKVEFPMIGDPTGKLSKDLDKVPEDATKAMNYYHKTILSDMAKAREEADALETLTDEEYWPFPVYSDLLFSEN